MDGVTKHLWISNLVTWKSIIAIFGLIFHDSVKTLKIFESIKNIYSTKLSSRSL